MFVIYGGGHQFWSLLGCPVAVGASDQLVFLALSSMRVCKRIITSLIIYASYALPKKHNNPTTHIFLPFSGCII
jgi:hypothetical protein